MKKFTLFLSALLISAMSFAATYTHTFVSNELSTGEVTLSEVAWTTTMEGSTFYGWDGSTSKGIQIGSKNSPCTLYTLKTSAFAEKITSVTVNASIASGGTAKLSIMVGETAYLSAQALTTDATDYTATGSATGDLLISFENDAKAFYIKSITVTYGEDGGEDPGEGGSDLWLLVTDASTLSVGDQVVIAAAEADAALSTNQKTNNRGQANVTKSANTLTINEEVQVLTLETGNKANTLALNTGSGYLYAASSSSNHLRTETTLSDNSSWVITISEGVASVVAQGENTHNVMQYNQQSSLFACYGSASQGAIALYKKASAEGVILAPTITGEVNFLDKTTVSITAEDGLKVYYTLDGTEPTNASTEYTAPFELTATTTVKAVAYDGDKASAVVSKTFTKTPLIGCAEANALAKGEIAYMKPFDIVYVVEGAGYIYIKDETGTALIYSYDWDEPTYFVAGDHVEGFIGKSSPYNGLPELKPNVDYNDLTITKGGAASEPTIFAEAPLATDVHKYVQFNGVKFTESATFEEGVASNATMLVGETEVTLRNAFKLGADFVAEKPYNVVGFVAIFNEDIQVYFLSAEALTTAVDNVTIDQNITKFFENGQLVIIKNGVRYNAQGAVVK